MFANTLKSKSETFSLKGQKLKSSFCSLQHYSYEGFFCKHAHIFLCLHAFIQKVVYIRNPILNNLVDGCDQSILAL